MTRLLTIDEILELHRLVLEQSGGKDGLRDQVGLESAVAQPQMAFSGRDLYLTLSQKAAALCHSLVANHPFIDDNKRVGHAAMETFLVLNGHEIVVPIDEQERVILDLASGSMSREAFTDWVEKHVRPLSD